MGPMQQPLFDFLEKLDPAASAEALGWTFIDFARELGADGANIWFACGSAAGEDGTQCYRYSEATTYSAEARWCIDHETAFEAREVPRQVARGGLPFRSGYDVDTRRFDRGSDDYRTTEILQHFDRRRNALIVPVPTRGQLGTSGVSFHADAPVASFDRFLDENGALLVHAGMATHLAMQEREREAKTAPALSRRERECVLWLSKGHRTKDIARRLGVSPAAVSLYLGKARRKLGATNREQLVVMAFRLGIIC